MLLKKIGEDTVIQMFPQAFIRQEYTFLLILKN